MDGRLPNILIVDDDFQTLRTMSLYLRDMARVYTAPGGRQALDFVRQNPVDIILLDLEMPMMDGFATLEQLRKLEQCINVSIILITGVNDKCTIINLGIMGIDGYLLKPVSKDTLIQKVEEVYKAKEFKNNRKTVLMIDDDITYLKQLNTFLQDAYNVVMINSSKLALNYLLKHTPDIILLDYEMPFYNGVNVMHMIQKNNPNIHIPIIILSGTLDRAALSKCYSCNPNAYLAKPVSKDILLETISNILEE